MTTCGTTDLFAGMDIATGEIIFDTKKRQTATDGLSFFEVIDFPVPPHLDVHLVIRDLSAHRARRWPSGLHTPMASAGTHDGPPPQIECWFSPRAPSGSRGSRGAGLGLGTEILETKSPGGVGEWGYGEPARGRSITRGVSGGDVEFEAERPAADDTCSRQAPFS